VIHPSHGVQIFVATKPVDFRKERDGLAALVQSHLQKKPFDGAVYVFRAKREDRLKMFWWDGMGLVEPPHLKWSAPIVRKAEDQRWQLRDPSPKRLS